MLGDRVLFLDGEALVIDKPAGLPVDPPRDGALSLENHLGCAHLRLPALAGRGASARSRHQRLPAAVAQPQGAGALPAGVRGGAGARSAISRSSMACSRASAARSSWRCARSPAPSAAGGSRSTRAARRRAPTGELLDDSGRTRPGRLHPAYRAARISSASMRARGSACRSSAIRSTAARDAGGMMLHAAAMTLPRPGKEDAAAEAPCPSASPRSASPTRLPGCRRSGCRSARRAPRRLSAGRWSRSRSPARSRSTATN